MKAPRAFLLLALATAAPGQSRVPTVDPQPFRWLPAARETGFPFGYPTRTVLRYQQVHDGLRGRARTITALALRRSTSNQAAVPAFTATFAMRLSTARTTAATIDPVFANNEGADVRTVLTERAVSFPRTQGPYPAVAPFEIVLPTDAPFGFGGGGPLCFELRLRTHDNAVPMTFDLYQDGQMQLGTSGQACAGLAMTTTVSAQTATHHASGLPPAAPAVFLAGVEVEQLRGTALPFDLTLLGAPGCSLAVAPALSVPGFADANGDHQVQVALGSLQSGAWYAAQTVAVQPGINPLGAALTDAAIVVPQTGRLAGRVWAESLGATQGLAQPIYALVLELR